MAAEYAIEMRGITKTFGSVVGILGFIQDNIGIIQGASSHIS